MLGVTLLIRLSKNVPIPFPFSLDGWNQFGEKPVHFCMWAVFASVWILSSELFELNKFKKYAWMVAYAVGCLGLLLMLRDRGDLFYIPLIPLLDRLLPPLAEPVYHFVLILIPPFLFNIPLACVVVFTDCVIMIGYTVCLLFAAATFVAECTLYGYTVGFVGLAWARVALRHAADLLHLTARIADAKKASPSLAVPAALTASHSFPVIGRFWAALDRVETARLEEFEWTLRHLWDEVTYGQWRIPGRARLAVQILQPLQQHLAERIKLRAPPPPSLYEGTLQEIERLAGVFINYLLPFSSLDHLRQPFSRAVFCPYPADLDVFHVVLELYLLEVENAHVPVDAAKEALDDCLRRSTLQMRARKDQKRLDDEILTAVLRWKERKNDTVKQRLKQAQS